MSMWHLIRCALLTPMPRGRWGAPIIFEGEPGVGKSDIIEAIAAAMKMPCEVLCPGERGDAAFGVVPVPENGYLTYPLPEWVRQFEDNGGFGLVFVDEMSTAEERLQPALLGLVHARRIGGGYLPDRVRVLSATNKPEDSAHGHELSAPLANRFGHIQWDPGSAEDWIAYELAGNECPWPAVDLASEERRVLEAWPLAYSKSKGLWTSFIKSRPELLHKMPAVSDPQRSKAWPSRRSTDTAIRAWAAAEVNGLDTADKITFVSAFVGPAVMKEFLVYATKMDLPDPAEILDGNLKWVHDPHRLDRTHAVFNACTALILPPKAAKREARAKMLFALLEQTMPHGKDLLFHATRALAQNRLAFLDYPPYRKVMAGLNDVLTAAGIAA